MINAKVDLYTAGAVLGRKSAASTKRYAHLATEAIKTALSQIGKKSPHTKENAGCMNFMQTRVILGRPPESRTRHQRIMSPLL